MDLEILWVTALAWEADAVLSSVEVSWQGGDGEVTLRTGLAAGRPAGVLRMGIGQRSAEAAMAWASERVMASAVVVTGCAGALAPALRTGDVVIADEVVAGAVRMRSTSRRWVDRYERAARGAGLAVRQGAILTTASILATVAEKNAAGAGAIAVAMEDSAVAAWAGARGMEFASVRVILDPIDMIVPAEISAIVGRSGRVFPSRLLSAVVRKPGVVRELGRLASAQRKCRRALRAIHRFVVEDRSD